MKISCLLAIFAFSALAATSGAAQAAPLEVRVVVVTTFELGADTGDAPGEFQTWVERLPLSETIAFPQGYRRLRYNAARHVLGIVTGEGAEHGAASIMALGLDSRFDLSRAYWVVAGIAGVDPSAGSVGSAAWARYVVNGDLAYEVDGRDLPPEWKTGLVPLERTRPYARPAPPANSLDGIAAYSLNAALANWAYRRTRAIPLADDPALRAIRSGYPERLTQAHRPPFVFEGDDLAGDRFWLGGHMNAWAERWVPYWTNLGGTFAMSDEEDAGIMQALTFLAQTRRADLKRVLSLRTASDFTVPRRGQTLPQLIASDSGLTGGSAYRESLEAAYRVGSVVVKELATNWQRYASRVPGAP